MKWRSDFKDMADKPAVNTFNAAETRAVYRAIFDPSTVAALLNMPESAAPKALLCISPVHVFYREPMLQQERWARRCPLDELLFENRWGQVLHASAALDTPLP